MNTLLYQYAALQPVSHLVLLPPLDLARSQDELIRLLLLNQTLIKYPPARNYRRSFWKRLVGVLESAVSLPEAEEEELEVDEAIYDAYLLAIQPDDSDPIAQSSFSPPGQSYKTFYFPSPSSPGLSSAPPSTNPSIVSDTSITLKEEQKTIQAGTTGLRTWGASLRLAELILSKPELLPDTSDGRATGVLELGAGVGFLGILVGMLMKSRGGKGKVALTDLDPRVLQSLEDNVALNGLSSEIAVERLDWDDILSPNKTDRDDVTSLVDRIDPGLVIAADVVYDPSIIPPLIATLSHLLQPRSHSQPQMQTRINEPTPAPPFEKKVAAIIASTVRNENTFDLFIKAAREANLRPTSIDISSLRPIFWGCGEGGGSTDSADVRIVRFEYDP
ncbi:Predicted methyltransferase [Phaffia rhodozyma]|uniref:Predicted methyltransferase n=1 Tax=Phaffia rhodozyma TaxID=264483 RepID=A0A0F7SSV3_PHARH|nr:Predicted methyltransferase [Phaffia rhodozyma]